MDGLIAIILVAAVSWGTLLGVNQLLLIRNGKTKPVVLSLKHRRIIAGVVWWLLFVYLCTYGSYAVHQAAERAGRGYGEDLFLLTLIVPPLTVGALVLTYRWIKQV